MDYSMISKIEKAKIYSTERERIQFESLSVQIKGDNNSPHNVQYEQGIWRCDCNYFSSRGICSHTMAMERVLVDMVELGQVLH